HRATVAGPGAGGVTPRPGIMRRLVTLLLLVPLFWLTSLAYASPPDQTWIGGFYDDADYDDVVLLALSLAVALGDPVLALDARPVVVAILSSSTFGPCCPSCGPAPPAAHRPSPSRSPSYCRGPLPWP